MAETILATVLLALISLAVVNLFPSTLSVVNRARQENLANLTAHDQLERLAALPFDSLVLGTQDLGDPPLPEGFTLTGEVLSVNGYSTTHLKAIRTTVSWSQKGKERSVQQELYVHSVRR